jgi:hypothetical protein
MATYFCVGFEVLKAEVKSSVFWDITQCIPLKSQPTFRWNMSPPSSGSMNKSSVKKVASRGEDGGDMFL